MLISSAPIEHEIYGYMNAELKIHHKYFHLRYFSSSLFEIKKKIKMKATTTTMSIRHILLLCHALFGFFSFHKWRAANIEQTFFLFSSLFISKLRDSFFSLFSFHCLSESGLVWSGLVWSEYALK